MDPVGAAAGSRSVVDALGTGCLTRKLATTKRDGEKQKLWRRLEKNELGFSYREAVDSAVRMITSVVAICWRLRDCVSERLRAPPLVEVVRVMQSADGLKYLPAVKLWTVVHKDLMTLCGEMTQHCNALSNILQKNDDPGRCCPSDILRSILCGWVRTYYRLESERPEFDWVRSAFRGVEPRMQMLGALEGSIIF